MKTKTLFSALIILTASCGGASAPVDESVDSTARVATTDSVVVDAATTTAPDAATNPSHMDDAAADDHMDDNDHTTDAHTDDMDSSLMRVGLADEGAIAERTIEIVMTEFAFEPGPIDVVAGETIEFSVHNEGAIQHEFRITTLEAIDHHVAEGHADHTDEMEPGVMLIDPSHSGSMLVTFHEAGEFNMIACLIPAHYEAGMATELNIDG